VKGNPFKLTARKDGSFTVYNRASRDPTLEERVKEQYFREESILNLDELRPDGFKDCTWYEIKIGSLKMEGFDWLRCSRYFPEVYFPPYYCQPGRDVDSQLERYVEAGYVPLRVMVFSPSGEVIREHTFLGRADLE